MDRRNAIRLALLGAVGSLLPGQEASACGGGEGAGAPRYPTLILATDDAKVREAALDTAGLCAAESGKPLLVSIAANGPGPFPFPYASIAGLAHVYTSRHTVALARLALFEITCLPRERVAFPEGPPPDATLLVRDDPGRAALQAVRPTAEDPYLLGFVHPALPFEKSTVNALLVAVERRLDEYEARCRTALSPVENAALDARLERELKAPERASSLVGTFPGSAAAYSEWGPIKKGAAIVLSRARRAPTEIQRERLLDLLAWAELCDRAARPPAGSVWGSPPQAPRASPPVEGVLCGMGSISGRASVFLSTFTHTV